MKLSHSRQSGFTMIELLITMSLFGILSAVVAGTFINIIRTQKTLMRLIEANDNASLVIEQIAREIRTGHEFSASHNDEELCFTNAKDERVRYRYDNDAKTIVRAVGGVMDSCSSLRDQNALISNDVRIQFLKFYLHGADSRGDNMPTLVTLVFTLSGGRGLIENIEINLQTSISSRILDS